MLYQLEGARIYGKIVLKITAITTAQTYALIHADKY